MSGWSEIPLESATGCFCVDVSDPRLQQIAVRGRVIPGVAAGLSGFLPGMPRCDYCDHGASAAFDDGD